jgi:hypothetical protein
MRAGIVLGIVGIVLAAALGFAAHVVAQDTIGLPAVSLNGGRPLAPEQAHPKKRTTERTETETEPETTTTTTVDDHGGSRSGPGWGDDSGGHGRNRGRGSDD